MSQAVGDFRIEVSSIEGETGYSVEFSDGTGFDCYNGRPACTFLVKNERQWRQLINSDAYQIAKAFIRSEFDVERDLVAAVKVFRKNFLAHARLGWKTLLTRPREKLQERFGKGSSKENIRFHYDRSNDFYRCFLDERMVYSCAYFRNPSTPLEAAQLAKLDHICRKLQLQPGHRVLDIGCGWGALTLHSAGRYGTFSTGCTLSSNQLTWALSRAQETGLEDRASLLLSDYREVSGTFDRIASVGMFEHVGKRALDNYFSLVAELLAENGLFLNHGIVRPSTVRTGPETLFLTRYVFPGGALVRLIDVIDSAEKAGLEVLDTENLRPHYALTCKAWVEALTRNKAECLTQVDVETYRTWLLYLAASSAAFEEGDTEIHQVLFAKRGGLGRPLTRDYMYA